MLCLNRSLLMQDRDELGIVPIIWKDTDGTKSAALPGTGGPQLA